jgi:chromosome segregation ATPase
MKDARGILIAFLVGITFFSVFKYISSFKEKYDLNSNLEQVSRQVAALEDEKKGLMQDFEKEKALYQKATEESLQLKDNLNLTQEKLNQLGSELYASEKTIEELSSQFSAVRAENLALRDQIQSLDLEMAKVVQDKEKLQTRLSSIADLKKAIKDLRQQMRQTKKEIQIRTKTGEIMLGNQGFVIKDGKPTYPTRVKIEVETLAITHP